MAEAARTTLAATNALHPTASRGQRQLAHGLAALIGILSFVAGIASIATGQQPVLSVTLLVTGALMGLLVWKSLHYSRPAWSFLIAIASVLGTVMLFGAPKVASLVGIQLFMAFVFPALQVACVVALAGLRHDYRD
jgi:hypothetical protein